LRCRHPDKNPDNLEEAEVHFKQISAAYSLLTMPEEEQSYGADFCDMDAAMDMLYEL
jgi:curved DNA-binding protein CbpA